MPLRNHILMGPTETHFTREDGCISQEEIAYYVERAAWTARSPWLT